MIEKLTYDIFRKLRIGNNFIDLYGLGLRNDYTTQERTESCPKLYFDKDAEGNEIIFTTIIDLLEYACGVELPLPEIGDTPDGGYRDITSGSLNLDEVISKMTNGTIPTLEIANKVILDAQKSNNNIWMPIDAKEVILNNIYAQAAADKGAYNLFEQPQSVKEPINQFEANEVKIAGANLMHNVFNLYNLAEGAVIVVKNSSFDLNVATSNVLRLSNYKNVDNVKVIFENINWTYENVPYAEDNLAWAGLIIYQPAGEDSALKGDLSHLNTWSFEFRNCKYNGRLITENEFGKISNAIYLYDINNSKVSEDPKGLNISFA